MSSAEQKQEIEALSGQIEQMRLLLATCERERDENAVCEKLAREELEDVQQQLIRLKGWQDCAREILSGSRSPT
jgi:hypothetical protein